MSGDVITQVELDTDFDEAIIAAQHDDADLLAAEEFMSQEPILAGITGMDSKLIRANRYLPSELINTEAPKSEEPAPAPTI